MNRHSPAERAEILRAAGDISITSAMLCAALNGLRGESASLRRDSGRLRERARRLRSQPRS